MHALRRCHRFFLGAVLGVGLLVIGAPPAFAMGHRGDPGEIAAMRGASSEHGFDVGRSSSQAAPEIDGGVVATAIALVVGGLLVVLDRRPR